LTVFLWPAVVSRKEPEVKPVLADITVRQSAAPVAMAVDNGQTVIDDKSSELTSASGKAPPVVIDWDAALPAGASRRAAFASLFGVWGLSYDGSKDGRPCAFARSAGLECFFTVTGFRDLYQLNRPAVLQMNSNGGREFFLVLVELTEDQAVVRAGDRQWRLDRAALAMNWTGRVTVLWKPPVGSVRFLSAGDHSPVVGWLTTVLDCRPVTDSVADGVYRDGLVAAVKRFQIEKDLVPDGKLGARTLIMLRHRAGEDGPLLHGVHQSGCQSLLRGGAE